MKDTGDGWFRTRVPVRFRDLDAMGHAHHTLPLIYLEEARAEFWRGIKGGDSLDSIDYVLAEITLRFHARILYPSVLTVALAVTRVGEKSFTTEFEMRDDAGALLAGGTAVHVAYDYAGARSRPLQAGDRDELSAWRDAAARARGTPARSAPARSTRSQNSSASPADIAPITPPST